MPRKRIEEVVAFAPIELEEWLRIHYPKVLREYERYKYSENVIIQE